MPSAYVEPQGNWRFGVSRMGPFETLYTTVSAIDWLEVNGRFTQINGVAVSTSPHWAGYGDYKDKAFDIKWRLLPEGDLWPAVALGAQDFFGTQLYKSRYLAMSKRLQAGPWRWEGTLGYGQDRIDGVFGGVSVRHDHLPGWRLTWERDATAYHRDAYRPAGWADTVQGKNRVAVGYEWGWLGVSVQKRLGAGSGGGTGVNAYVNIPLERSSLVPRVREPAPYGNPQAVRPSPAQWAGEPVWAQAMLRALWQQEFQDVRLALEGDTLRAEMGQGRISDINRAAGRAARVLMTHAPTTVRHLHLIFTERGVALAQFAIPFDAPTVAMLEGRGAAPEQAPNPEVRETAVHGGERLASDYADPADRLPAQAAEPAVRQAMDAEGVSQRQTLDGDEGEWAWRQTRSDQSRIKVAPKLSLFLNDPSGFLRYDLALQAGLTQRLAERTFVDAVASLTLHETVSDATQPSDSTLPHVRSDVAQYKAQGGIKLHRLMLNHYLHPAPRLYGRVSAGLYEEMFGGAGTQWLYLPAYQPWAVDVAVDALRQREVGGSLKWRDYRTVTAVVSGHWRLPQGVTATLRAGRFLAKDQAARLELKRRFASGVELGAWYTRSQAVDTVGGKRYHDKGVFVNIPLNTLIGKDTRAEVGLSLSPWTRDLGQLVTSPGDLYDMVERPLMQDLPAADGLKAFAQ